MGLSALAVLSKETAVVLIGLIPLTVLIRPAWPWRRAVVAVGLGLAIAWILRALVLGPIVSPGGLNASRNPLVDAELLGRAIGATTVLRLAGQHLFWPVNLAPDYSPHAVPVGTVHDIVLVGLGLLAIGFWAWRSRGRVAIAVSLVILPLLPVSSIVVPIGAFYADRWLYLSAVGAAILVGEVLGTLRRPLTVAFAAVLIVLGAIQTWATLPAWRSNTALAARMVEATPRNGYAHFFQATAAAKEKQWGTVERALRAAWRDVTPGARGRVAFSLGSFIWHRDRDRALRWFRLANSYPDVLLVEGYRTFSRVLREAGDVNGAAWAAEQARQLQAVLNSRPGRGRSSLTP
ncbi:MAG: hypothetical protein HYV08_11785 [Deltaproteobacteria bacterium]|nr:hypothetical protein [Deltaproteobacteria bacterium]